MEWSKDKPEESGKTRENGRAGLRPIGFKLRNRTTP
jgi:hypothetical protein